MPRKRKTHKHLPHRVYFKNGRYRLLTKENKWITLGKNLSEMYQALSELHIQPIKMETFYKVIDRYMIEVSGQKAESTYKSEVRRARFIREFFGDMTAIDITPVHIYQYLDIRGRKGKIAANREFALLSHIFSYGIRWGVVKINPCTGVKKHPENRRNRNVTDHEYNAALSVAEYPINFAMQLAYYMALRPTEVLNLKRTNILEKGFLIELTKTKKSMPKKLVQWTPKLKAIIQEINIYNKYRITGIDYLLVNREGKPYTHDAFTKYWSTTIEKALKDNLISESFQFRDLRHKAATDMERIKGLEASRKFLGHKTQNTTSGYIDGVAIVEGLG